MRMLAIAATLALLAGPALAATTSVITPGSGTIADSHNNLFSIDKNGNAIENGQNMAGGGGTGKMVIVDDTVYGQDANTGTWYTWNGSGWSKAASAPDLNPTPPPVNTKASPDGTLVNAGSNGSITDNAGNVWTIDKNNQIDYNGHVRTSSKNATAIAWVGGKIWYVNTDGVWFSTDGPHSPFSAGTKTPPLNVGTTKTTADITINIGGTENGQSCATQQATDLKNVITVTANGSKTTYYCRTNTTLPAPKSQ